MRDRLAIVLSTTALAVAVLGSTPAGNALADAVPRKSVGTAQLKDRAVTSTKLALQSVRAANIRDGNVTAAKLAPNAVTSAHVRDGSLVQADFKPGELSTGPPGPSGPAGPAGPQGPTGPPGLSEYQIVQMASFVSNQNFNTRTVTCPAGKHAVGGGAASSVTNASEGPYIHHSRPTPDGGGWTVGTTRSPVGSWTMTAYAVCAKVGP